MNDLGPQERLYLYRSRHTIEPIAAGELYVCETDGIRVVPRRLRDRRRLGIPSRLGWRHDPDELEKLMVAALRAPDASTPDRKGRASGPQDLNPSPGRGSAAESTRPGNEPSRLDALRPTGYRNGTPDDPATAGTRRHTMPDDKALAITVEVKLKQRDAGDRSYPTWEDVVTTESTISLPVPNPDALAPLVSATVDHMIAIARSKGLVADAPELAAAEAPSDLDAAPEEASEEEPASPFEAMPSF